VAPVPAGASALMLADVACRAAARGRGASSPTARRGGADPC